MEVCRQPRAMHRALITNHTSEVVRVEATGPLSDVAQFLLDLACKEFTEDLGATPVHITGVYEKYGSGQWSGLLCCCVTQASGESRRIDNGNRSWTNTATSYSEEFQMTTAFLLVIVAHALREAVEALGADKVLAMIADL